MPPYLSTFTNAFRIRGPVERPLPVDGPEGRVEADGVAGHGGQVDRSPPAAKTPGGFLSGGKGLT